MQNLGKKDKIFNVFSFKKNFWSHFWGQFWRPMWLSQISGKNFYDSFLLKIIKEGTHNVYPCSCVALARGYLTCLSGPQSKELPSPSPYHLEKSLPSARAHPRSMTKGCKKERVNFILRSGNWLKDGFLSSGYFLHSQPTFRKVYIWIRKHLWILVVNDLKKKHQGD